MSGIVIGAYIASPALLSWDADAEHAYFDGITAIDGIRGLELPWIGSLHPADDDWLLDHLKPEWDNVITSIGYTTGAVARDPRHGIASTDAEGRAAALSNVRSILDGVHRVNDRAARRSVIGIELHSAPRRSSPNVADAAALHESLTEIADWDWDGADVLIEHADAFVSEDRSAKGYLALSDEIEAITDLPRSIGIALNWGRSALELRDPDAVVDHVRLARESGRLRAHIFSGVADVETSYGPAWSDAHLPWAPAARTSASAEGSLLTIDRASRVLEESGHLDWVGAKIGWRPFDAPLEERLTLIRETVEVLNEIA